MPVLQTPRTPLTQPTMAQEAPATPAQRMQQWLTLRMIPLISQALPPQVAPLMRSALPMFMARNLSPERARQIVELLENMAREAREVFDGDRH